MTLTRVKTIDLADIEPSKYSPLRTYQVIYLDGRIERYRAHIASEQFGSVTLRFIPAKGPEILVLHSSRVAEVRYVDERPGSIWTVLRAATVKASRFI